jgi:hypothetical protein
MISAAWLVLAFPFAQDAFVSSVRLLQVAS